MTLLRSRQLVEPVTIGDLLGLDTGEIMAMPTISSGHFDDLKFDNGRLRLWASRQKMADYVSGGRASKEYAEERAAYARDRFVIEELVDGVWTRRCCACPDAACHDEKKPYRYGTPFYLELLLGKEK